MNNAQRRFTQLFDGLQRVRGSYKLKPGARDDAKDKVVGAAKTVKEMVRAEHWENHFSGIEGLGLVPIRDDQCCMFAAIDIDEYDLDLKKLNTKIAARFPFFVVCRTKSGGAHVYVFFTEPAPADEVREKLTQLATAIGFPSVEIFPKQKRLAPDDVGNWINLPYYNDKGPTNRYGLSTSGRALGTVEEFVDYVEETCRISPVEFFETELGEVDRFFEDGPPCLQRLHAMGVPAGMRNNSLFNIGIYYRSTGVDDWAKKLDAYNHDYVRPPVQSDEMGDIKKSLSKEKYHYKCEDQPIVSMCDRGTCLTRRFGIGRYHEDDGQWERLIKPPVKIGRAVNLVGDPIVDVETPMWVNIDDVEVELNWEVITMQEKFRQWIFLNKGVYFPKLKPHAWERFLQGLLENPMYVDIPFINTKAGAILGHILNFCTDYSLADVKEEVTTEKVWHEKDGEPYVFTAAAIQGFLRKRQWMREGEQKKIRELNKILREDLGAEFKSFRWGTSSSEVVSAWYVPDKVIAKPPAIPVKLPESDF